MSASKWGGGVGERMGGWVCQRTTHHTHQLACTTLWPLPPLLHTHRPGRCPPRAAPAARWCLAAGWRRWRQSRGPPGVVEGCG